LRAGLKNGGLPADAVHVVRDASQASAWLSDLGEGDVVLIKGRRAQRMKALVLALLERHA
jgi:hypothetical protein